MGLKASEGTLGSGLGSLGVMYFAVDTVMMYMTAGRACVCHGSLVCAGTITSKTRMSEFSKSTLWLEGGHRHAVSGIRFDDFARRLWGSRSWFCRQQEGKKNQAYEA